MGTLLALPLIMLALGAISIFSKRLTLKLGKRPWHLVVVQLVMGLLVAALIAFAIVRISSTH